MSDVFDIKDRAWKRRSKRVSLPPLMAKAISDFGIPDPGDFAFFKLKTVREGCEVWLLSSDDKRQCHMINYSIMTKTYPKNFADARQWMKAIGSGLGYDLQEIKRPQYPRAKGEDRKIYKAGGCKESWLDSDVPELWAEACCRCKHLGAYCGQDGFCHLGGCNMIMDVEHDQDDEADEDDDE